MPVNVHYFNLNSLVDATDVHSLRIIAHTVYSVKGRASYSGLGIVTSCSKIEPLCYAPML